MRVQDVSSNLTDYGYPKLQSGESVEDQIDFMIGFDAKTKLDLPFVASPSGRPISVSLMPGEEVLTVVITDATSAKEHRQQLQQAANENELLVEKQKKLMHELELASKELEQKNQQLQEAARLQTSFLSGVSHEFRTPLTSIIGYTNLVKNELSRMSNDIVPRVTQEDNRDYLGAVQRSSKHLLSLVENLLDHGKLNSDEIVVRPKNTHLNELFEDVEIVLSPLSQTKGVDFNVSLLAEPNTHIIVDDSRLRQCLINLVGNAIKFTDIGSVTVDAKLVNEELFVEVIDTGIGINEEDLQKIRLPFFQAADTGKVGTGLGLTITEKIIELMGGELEIESEVGKGTHVKFSMPAPVQVVQEQLNDEQKVLNRNLRLLLAEDDTDIADLVIMLLTEAGVEVERVVNGALAIEALQKSSYDMVLMDIHMPIMTGYEAITEINRLGIKTPIVVMSASSAEADQQNAAQLGCAAYLVKPVSVGEILSIADTVLD